MHKTIFNLPIIAETAFNHEGDFEYLHRLIGAAAEAGASHVKFQVLINCDDFVSTSSEAYSVAKTWVFSQDSWERAFDYAESLGLRIFAMPLDIAAVEICKRESVDYVEIHSVSFYDSALVDLVKEELKEKTIAFGIGGRTLEELTKIVEQFEDHRLMFMAGYQAYPSELESVKIARIKFLKQHFPQVLFGYADHSAPETQDALYSSIYAYHLGARIFEKHLTLKHPRTDSQSAYSPQQLKTFVDELTRFISIIRQSEQEAFSMTENEIVYRNRQKKVVALTDIDAGDIFTIDNIGLRMHTAEGAQNRLESVLGRTSRLGYKSGDTIDE